MINCLKVFEIDPELRIISNESTTLKKFEPQVSDFFRDHILKSVSDTHSKAARFKDDSDDIFKQCFECFSDSNFDKNSKKIAESLINNIHINVKKDFIFIVLSYTFETKDKNAWINVGEEILAIMKMETSDGIQIIDNDFDIHENMLPDLGNNLQKCSFVYKTKIENFDINNKGKEFHLKILDKQDKSISTYFINLMKSVVVADNEEMSKLAQRVIKKNLKNYIASEATREELDRDFRIIMSRRKRTSIKNIVEELFPILDKDRVHNSGITPKGLGDDVFKQILQINPSALNSFVAEPVNCPRYILRNKDHSVNLSIEKGLIDDGIVFIDDTNDNKNIIIKIPKKLMEN